MDSGVDVQLLTSLDPQRGVRAGPRDSGTANGAASDNGAKDVDVPRATDGDGGSAAGCHKS